MTTYYKDASGMPLGGFDAVEGVLPELPVGAIEITQQEYESLLISSLSVESKVKRLKQLLDEMESSKMAVGYPCNLDACNTSIQCRNDEDKINLLAIHAMALQNCFNGAPTTVIACRCSMNISHSMASSAMLSLLGGMFAWANNISNVCHGHKDAIESQLTIYNDPQSTQAQKDAANLAISNYDISVGW